MQYVHSGFVQCVVVAASVLAVVVLVKGGKAISRPIVSILTHRDVARQDSVSHAARFGALEPATPAEPVTNGPRLASYVVNEPFVVMNSEEQRMRRISVTDRLAARIGGTTLFGRRVADVTAEARRRTVPRHWTNLFGVVTLACIVVVTVTGVVLMFFYTPSTDSTTYTGGYAPLHGAEVSKAFASTMYITFCLLYTSPSPRD